MYVCICAWHESCRGVIPAVSCRGRASPCLTVNSDSAHLLSRCHQVQTENSIFVVHRAAILSFFPLGFLSGLLMFLCPHTVYGSERQCEWENHLMTGRKMSAHLQWHSHVTLRLFSLIKRVLAIHHDVLTHTQVSAHVLFSGVSTRQLQTRFISLLWLDANQMLSMK